MIRQDEENEDEEEEEENDQAWDRANGRQEYS